MSDVHSEATITVILESGKQPVTVHAVRDWLAEVDRLHIPSDTPLDDCCLYVRFRSQVLDETHGESDLGVEGYDILVGMPR